MTRRNMLDIIMNCIKLDVEKYINGEVSLEDFTENCSKLILNRIECAGMLPPYRRISDDYEDLINDHKFVNEWSRE
jgi:hypothetical protein